MEKIRIFYAADLHGDFDSLKTIRKYLGGENFDITLINGDLIHIPFSEKEVKAYLEPRQKIQEVIQKFAEKKMELLMNIGKEHDVQPQLIEENISPEILVKIKKDQITLMEVYALRDTIELPLSIRGAIGGYSKAKEELTDIQKEFKKHEEKYITLAETNMKNTYKEIKQTLSGIEYMTLPGNRDGKCLEEILGEESLHKKTKEIKGVKLTGYGGAAVTMSIVPSVFIEYIEGVTEEEGQEALYSEPHTLIMDENPDIAVIHEVPGGAIPNIGSKGLGIYVAQKNPSIVLAAHMHEFCGVYPFLSNDKSVLVMPGKLGGYVSPNYSKRHDNLRTFAEIEATKDKKELIADKVIIKRLTDKKEIKTLSEYNLTNL